MKELEGSRQHLHQEGKSNGVHAFLLALPKHYMSILIGRNGSWILVVHITCLRMLLYFCFNEAKEQTIFVVDGYALTVASNGSVNCENRMINDVHHMYTVQLSANLLFVPKITQIGKEIEFWPNKFTMKDINNNFVLLHVLLT